MAPKAAKNLRRAALAAATIVVAAVVTGSPSADDLHFGPGSPLRFSVAADTIPTCDPGYQPMSVSSDINDPIASRYRESILLCLLDRGPNASPRFSTEVINKSPMVWIVQNAPAWSPAATAEESASVQAFRFAAEEFWGGVGTLAIEPDHTGYFESEPGDPWPSLSVDLGTQGMWEAATQGARALEKKAPNLAASLIKSRSPAGYVVIKCAVSGYTVASNLSDPGAPTTSDYLKAFFTGVRGANSCISAVRDANAQEPSTPRRPHLELADFDTARIENPQLLQRGETALAENVNASQLRRAGQIAGNLFVRWLK